jgi:hypothetical protein
MTENNGTFQSDKGGIDWYHYLTTILLPISFILVVMECRIGRPDIIIREDKAPA